MVPSTNNRLKNTYVAKNKRIEKIRQIFIKSVYISEIRNIYLENTSIFQIYSTPTFPRSDERWGGGYLIKQRKICSYHHSITSTMYSPISRSHERFCYKKFIKFFRHRQERNITTKYDIWGLGGEKNAIT